MRRPPRLRPMAKETSSADSSLPLHEVLEAEYVALHGELPSGYPSSSESKTRLKALWDAIHGLKEKRAALCCLCSPPSKPSAIMPSNPPQPTWQTSIRRVDDGTVQGWHNNYRATAGWSQKPHRWDSTLHYVSQAAPDYRSSKQAPLCLRVPEAAWIAAPAVRTGPC